MLLYIIGKILGRYLPYFIYPINTSNIKSLSLNSNYFPPSVKCIVPYDFFTDFNRGIRVIGVKVQQFHAKISQLIKHWRAISSLSTYTFPLSLFIKVCIDRKMDASI